MRRALAFVVGHGERAPIGKPRQMDPGAAYDLDQDGEIEQGETETALSRAVAWTSLVYLTAEAAPCLVCDVGTYSERVMQVAAFARAHESGDVIFLHCNAGLPPGMSRALTAHLTRSESGRHAAERLAECIDDYHIGDGDGTQIVAVGAGEQESWRRNMYNVLVPSWGLPSAWCGVLAEPFHVAGLYKSNRTVRASWIARTVDALCDFALLEDNDR